MSYWHDEFFEEPWQLIEFFLRNNWFRTKSKFSANHTGKTGMIFRGQSDSRWELSPSAFRPGNLERFTPQPPGDMGAVRRTLGRHLHAEARAVYLFMEHADSMGIQTPLDYTVTKHGMDIVLAALNDVENFDYTIPFPNDSFQRATALAQHHGVPTRFLDWSESPLVASYFAAYDASSFAANKPTDDQEIAVVFMSVNSLSDNDSPAVLVQAPRHENSHLLQQKGVFTTIRHANTYFIEHKSWPTLNDFSSGEFQLHRVRLPAKRADDLLRELFDLDITRHSLMPNLNNAAQAYAYVKELFDKS